MGFTRQISEQYRLIHLSDPDEQSHIQTPLRKSSRYLSGQWLLLIILVAGFLTLGYLAYGIAVTGAAHSISACKNASLRREWRGLSNSEKDDYLNVVQCLRTVPSKLSPHHSLYDDFPWVHSRIGAKYHDTAGFLAWHRYFLHVYEDSLREHCGYIGGLSYWDWSLDSDNFTNSPVWDIEHGFGGDGDPASPITVGDGHCVTAGPFSGVVALFYGHDANAHCLSRGFREGEALIHHCTSQIGPGVIETLLQSSDYNSFKLKLEHGPHRAIPDGIRGDWFKFSVPYDPVFFLHHSQIDRLWYLWQQRDFSKRVAEYRGKTSDSSDRSASLADLLDMGNLARGLTVAEVINTKSGILCYEY